MFDKILMQDLKDFKIGVDNIYNLQFRYSEIIRVVKNRTQEKLNLLKLFLGYHPHVFNNILQKFNLSQKNRGLTVSYKYGTLINIE